MGNAQNMVFGGAGENTSQRKANVAVFKKMQGVFQIARFVAQQVSFNPSDTEFIEERGILRKQNEEEK